MNILLIGHACGPDMGSEPGFTWNWAQSLSRHHHVWVITHPQFRDKVVLWQAQNHNPRVQFVWVDVTSVFDPWKPSQGERGIHIHYLLWLREAYKVAQRLCREVPFDVAHHVSWGTLRAAPPLWKLPVPTVWGPVGGAQNTPFRFLKYFGLHAGREVLRAMLTRTLYFSPRLRKAAKSAAVVFVTNRESHRMLKRFPGACVELLLDGGLAPDTVPEAPLSRPFHKSFTLLWAGRLEHRKALPLALEAVAGARNSLISLQIAGGGPLKAKLQQLAETLGIANRVEFLGPVPYSRMQTLFQSSDAFLFTSLRDSFGSVVLEAMAQGLPIISLDHHGVGTFVPDAAGIKIPVNKRRDTVQALIQAIERLASSPSLCAEMQRAAWTFAKDQTWDRRALQMTETYKAVIGRSTSCPSPLPITRTAVPPAAIEL